VNASVLLLGPAVVQEPNSCLNMKPSRESRCLWQVKGCWGRALLQIAVLGDRVRGGSQPEPGQLQAPEPTPQIWWQQWLAVPCPSTSPHGCAGRGPHCGPVLPRCEDL